MTISSSTDAEVLGKIAELKADIGGVSATLNDHVKPGKYLTEARFETGEKKIVDAIKKGKDEQKDVLEALMEASKLKDLFEAFKQADVIVVTVLAISAAISFLNGKVFSLGAILNRVAERITGRGGREPRIYNIDPDTGVLGRDTRANIAAQNAVSINPVGLTPEQIRSFNTELQAVTPKIAAFNTQVSAMRSPAELNRITKALEALKKALQPTPTNITPALRNLNAELRQYAPERLPKPADLRQSATAARDLRQGLPQLASALRSVANAVGS